MAHVAADARRVGLQPARPDRPEQRRRAAHGLVARAHRGTPAGHAAGPRRRDVHAQPGRRHPGDRRGHRRPPLGAPPRGPGRHRRLRLQHPVAEQPEPGDLRLVHHRHQRRRPHLRTRRHNRPAGVGNEDPGLPGEPRHPDLGPDRRRRQGDLGPELHARGGTERLRDHRPRRRHRRGTVAPAHHPRARRAGRRELGRRAVRGTQARRRVDGAELRPGAEPGLHRDLGHLAGAEVPDRRDGPPTPLPQLDAGAGRRHGGDRLVPTST